MDCLQSETRLRLLQAAGEIFAEQGYRKATIRDICSRAGANIAAVNYHFGDKEKLYAAVLQHWLGEALKKYPPDGDLPEGAPARERLKAFVRSWLFRMLGEGMPAWHGKLMAREMSEPTCAFEVLMNESVRPMSQRLTGIVKELLGPGVDERTVRDCALSVAGQCCFYRHAHEMITRLFPDHKGTVENIEHLAEHVTNFSLGAIESYGRKD